MKNVIALFDSAVSARLSIQALHAAGFTEDDIAFILNTSPDQGCASNTERTESTGRRVGKLAADVGESAASFIPFVGRNIIDSPMGRALRRAVQTAGATAGMLAGAMAD